MMIYDTQSPQPSTSNPVTVFIVLVKLNYPGRAGKPGNPQQSLELYQEMQILRVKPALIGKE